MKKPHLVTPAGNAAFALLRKVQAEHGGNMHKIALRYALERFLARIFVDSGPAAGRLLLNPENSVTLDPTTITLKGGMTLVFAEGLHPLKGRTTGDADLHLSAFAGTMKDYVGILRSVLAGPPPGEDDGVRFDVEALDLRRDREERTGGTVTIPVMVGPIWLQVKTDVSCDARPMHDRAPVLAYPTVLPAAGLAPPMVRRVPYEFMVSDKFAAAVEYGSANTRIRDYHDMRLILGKPETWDEGFLASTLAATMRFKGLELPADMDDAPGFGEAYALAKAARWEQEGRSRNFVVRDPFPEVLSWLRVRLAPVVEAARRVDAVPEWATAPR